MKSYASALLSAITLILVMFAGPAGNSADTCRPAIRAEPSPYSLSETQLLCEWFSGPFTGFTIYGWSLARKFNASPIVLRPFLLNCVRQSNGSYAAGYSLAALADLGGLEKEDLSIFQGSSEGDTEYMSVFNAYCRYRLNDNPDAQLQVLADALEDPDVDYYVVELLGRIGPAASQLAGTVSERLSGDRDVDVFNAHATLFLVGSGPEVHLRALQTATLDTTADSESRGWAARALASCGPHPEVIDTLRTFLIEDVPLGGPDLCDVFAALGPDAEPLIPTLIDQAKPEVIFPIDAAQALLCVGDSVIPYMVDLLDDENLDHRCMANYVLAKYGVDRIERFKELLRLDSLTAHSWQVGCFLFNLTHDPHLLPVALEDLSDPDSQSHLTDLLVIEEFRRLEEHQVIPVCIAALSDPDMGARDQAIQVLRRQGPNPLVVETLIAVLRDPSFDLQRVAVGSLETIAQSNGPASIAAAEEPLRAVFERLPANSTGREREFHDEIGRLIDWIERDRANAQ